jgi:16S rRNA (guanine527-N7)-methyltransferase
VISAEFFEQIRRRAHETGVSVGPSEIAGFEVYFQLLARWNPRINLTSLPLSGPTNETFERLFIEPLIAAAFIQNVDAVWFDLGSGGGSPALPLKIVRPALRLTMVESKARKAAFLREAVRRLELDRAEVALTRFEDLPPTADVQLVTVRAVRPDRDLFRVAAGLLECSGTLIIFHPRPETLDAPGFVLAKTAPSLGMFHAQ